MRRSRYRPTLVLLALLLPLGTRSALAFDPLNPLEEPKIGLLAIPAVAASIYFTKPDPADRDRVRGELRSHSWFILTQAGYYRSHVGRDTDIGEVRGAFGYTFRRWLSAGMEFNLTGLRDDEVRTAGIGGDLYARWQWPLTQKWVPYFLSGIGMIFTVDRFPPGGTNVNFTPLYGIGFLFRRFENAYFVGELRHLHISNAGVVAGDERNPGFDSIGGYLGWQFQF